MARDSGVGWRPIESNLALAQFKMQAANNLSERRNRWRLAAWLAAFALVLVVPWLAMQFTTEVHWTGSDFVFAGVLVAAVAFGYELAARKTPNRTYRAAAGVALLAAFILIWGNGAAGVIGSEGNPANQMYVAVIAIGIIGSLLARLRPQGMARALVAMAAAQVAVPLIALIAGMVPPGPGAAVELVMLTGFFSGLWLVSAWLFRKAAVD